MTPYGGMHRSGVLFSYDTSNNNYTVLYNFDAGYNHRGSLMQASDGKLYGVGGFNNYADNGSVFSFNPVND